MYIEFKENVFDDYLLIDNEQKRFLQQLIYMEYLERIEQERFKYKSPLTVQNTIYMDMIQYQEEENYEACKLFQDILKRFDKDFEDFE